MSVKYPKKDQREGQARKGPPKGKKGQDESLKAGDEHNPTLGEAIRDTGADRPVIPRPGQPPERGLKDDEPTWTRPPASDKREGVRREGSFRHVEKDGPKQHEEEE